MAERSEASRKKKDPRYVDAKRSFALFASLRSAILALWKRATYWALYLEGLTCIIFFYITVMLARRLVINPISDGIKLILIFGYLLFFPILLLLASLFDYLSKYSTIINSFRTIRNLVMGNTVARCFWKWNSCYIYSVNDNIIEQCSRTYCLLLYVRSDAENNQR